jgi:hypothetical protein
MGRYSVTKNKTPTVLVVVVMNTLLEGHQQQHHAHCTSTYSKPWPLSRSPVLASSTTRTTSIENTDEELHTHVF